MSYTVYDLWDELRKFEDFDDALRQLNRDYRTSLVAGRLAYSILKELTGTEDLGRILGTFCGVARDYIGEDIFVRANIDFGNYGYTYTEGRHEKESV